MWRGFSGYFPYTMSLLKAAFRFRFGHGDGLRQFSIAAGHARAAAAAADALMITG